MNSIKFITTILVLCTVMVAYSQKKEQLIGEWTLESIDGNLSKRVITYSFHKDGTVEVNNSKTISKGTWKFSDDKTSIIFKFIEGETIGKESKFSGDKFTFLAKKQKIVIKRKTGSVFL